MALGGSNQRPGIGEQHQAAEPAADEGHLEGRVGPGFAHAAHEGMHQPVDLGDREAADHADAARAGHRPGDDAAEIGGVLDVIVEDREIGQCRIGREARAHEIGGIGIIRRHLAGGLLDAEDLADDEAVAGLGIFPHHPVVVGIRDVLGEDVFDVPAFGRGIGGLVDAADPLLLHRDGIDRRHLQRIGGARPPREERCRQDRAAAGKHAAPRPGMGSRRHRRFSLLFPCCRKCPESLHRPGARTSGNRRVVPNSPRARPGRSQAGIGAMVQSRLRSNPSRMP